MKKLYTLLLIAASSFTFGQTFYSENMGTPTGTTPIATYATGTPPATFQNPAPIVYTGTGDVRATAVSNGYTGASGGGNVFLNADTEYFQIDGLNTSAYASADLQLSFGYITNTTTNQLIVEQSTNGTDWTALSFTNNANTSWNLVTIGGGQIASSSTLSLRFSVAGTPQMRIDDIKLSSVSASCTFAFGAATTVCDVVSSAMDTYTATIAFTGGGNATYSVVASSGTISGDNPSTSTSGNIIVSGVTEGTALTVTTTGGTCNLSLEVTAASCKPVNTLPYQMNFEYAAGSTLGSQQEWSTVNSGDEILITAGNLSYTGMTPSGNSASFSGSGIDATTPFTPTTSGNLYAGFLINVTDYSNVTTDGTETYFAVLTDEENNFRARLFMKKTGEQYQIGLASSGTTTTNYSSTSFNVGDTVYIVVGYDFATNTLAAWLNPNVATFTASTTPTLTDTPAAPFTSLGGFLLRQDGNTTTPSITVDGLRIATTVPGLLTVSQNAIAGLKVYPNPVNNGLLFISTDINETKEVSIFDVLGKLVIKTSVNEAPVNVANLTSGVYVVKITEAGKTATRKLVIN